MKGEGGGEGIKGAKGDKIETGGKKEREREREKGGTLIRDGGKGEERPPFLFLLPTFGLEVPIRFFPLSSCEWMTCTRTKKNLSPTGLLGQLLTKTCLGF